jgi:tetratricopeptide (TPR) repeat protein
MTGDEILPMPRTNDAPDGHPLLVSNSEAVKQAERALALARWRAQTGDREEARSLFENALTLAPSNVGYSCVYASFLAEEHAWRSARRQIQTAFVQDEEAVQSWLADQEEKTPSESGIRYLLAAVQVDQGHLDEAMMTYRALTDELPAEGELWAQRAAVAEAAGAFDIASDCYRAALALEADNADWLASYGLLLERLEQHQEAFISLEHALRIRPDMPVWQTQAHEIKRYLTREEDAHKLALRARLRLDDDLDEAAELAADALRLSPESDLAHYVQAKVLISQGQLRQAQAHLELALARKPEQPEYLVAMIDLQTQIEPLQGQVRELVGNARAAADPVQAYASLDKALTLLPDEVEAHVAYAEVLPAVQSAAAEQHLQAALAVDGHHIAAHRLYATLLQRQGRLQEATQHARAVLAAVPGDEETASIYSEALIQQGHYDEAADYLTLALQNAPNSVRLRSQLAVALVKLNRGEEARRYLDEALVLEPEDAALHRNYAELLTRTSEQPSQEIEEHLCKALALDPNDAVAHFLYARLLQARQEYKRAQEHGARAQALCPGNPDYTTLDQEIDHQYKAYRDAEAEMAYAILLGEQGRSQEARESFNDALNRAPRSVLVMKQYAEFCIGRRDWAEAERLLRDALTIVPGDEDAKQELAIVHDLHAQGDAAADVLPITEPPLVQKPAWPQQDTAVITPPSRLPPPPSSRWVRFRQWIGQLLGSSA